MPKREPLPDLSSVEAAAMGQVGDYKLIEQLGEGGMGKVYKARHAQLDRVEAVKILSRELIGNEQAVARFRREMRAVASLDHPHIVRAYNALEVEGNYLLVMEYVAGLNLAQVVQRLRQLPVADACELTRQAALGLQCAFEHDMVHRDIKPSNLMLTPAGQVKILDLGLARLGVSGKADRSVTSTGLVMGTPDYISPEQVRESHGVDIRADLYSLGCSLFELLCGQPPFAGKELAVYEKLAAHVEQPPPDMRSLRADIPADLAGIVSRMLAKDPEKRFATPQDVAGQLEPFTADSDCVRLLARASRVGVHDDAADESDVKLATAHAANTDAVAELTRPGTPPAPMSVARGWWKGALAGALLCLVAVAGVWALIARPWKPDDERASPATPDARQAGAAADAGPSPAPPADTGSAASSNWIVLSWAPPDEPLGLWLFSRDGEQQIRLTRQDDTVDIAPTFSPNARRIAFVRTKPGSAARSDLWVFDLESGDTRRVVAASGDSERLMSPVWLSDDRILYSRDPSPGTTTDTEVWQVSVGDTAVSPAALPAPELLFRFGDDSGNRVGVVADVAADLEQLLVVSGRARAPASSDVLITDLRGGLIADVWRDEQNELRDSRAIWSPDGARIAWQRQSATFPIRISIGLADLGDDGKWNARLQPAGRVPVVMPVAWNPDGEGLLCARPFGTPPESMRAAFILIGKNFEMAERLFDVPGGLSIAAQRHSGRLGDWALIPPDVALPPPARMPFNP